MNKEILLADDEATFRETVTTAENGVDAIDAVTKKAFALAILDIRMPKADGTKVLREITKIRPETRVIIISAFGTIEMAVEAIKLGACDYAVKPIVMED